MDEFFFFPISPLFQFLCQFLHHFSNHKTVPLRKRERLTFTCFAYLSKSGIKRAYETLKYGMLRSTPIWGSWDTKIRAYAHKHVYICIYERAYEKLKYGMLISTPIWGSLDTKIRAYAHKTLTYVYTRACLWDTQIWDADKHANMRLMIYQNKGVCSAQARLHAYETPKYEMLMSTPMSIFIFNGINI
jgi:hypothetical protein